MDLFASAGINIGDGASGGRAGHAAMSRTLRVPLLNHKVVADAQKNYTFDWTPEQKAAAASYAKTARSPRFSKEKETAVRPLLFDKVLGEILGYKKFESEGGYSLAFEYPIRRGTAVDVALGHFGIEKETIVAPFEFKGPTTTDLDAIMPGRGRSPVQQAWDYAIDAPGSKWVLVTNCLEIRLYGFGRGRDAFEHFDLTKLDDDNEHELERLWLLLSAERLLGGATEALLRQTDSAYADITSKLYTSYKSLRERLIAYLTDETGGPKHPPLTAIELAQKILDRILFIAFAQRTDLLPDRLLFGAATEKARYVPKPLWYNFQGLFRAVDEGSGTLNVWGYNGGLFAPDPLADALVIPDPLATDLATLGEWDYRSEVPVTVLGHIFEQSITDIERDRAIARGEAPPKVTKSKRQGVVYTPEIVTRFLVEHTIEVSLDERFDTLLKTHGKASGSRRGREQLFSEGEDDQQRTFWIAYLDVLRTFTVVDPACGSGAFLVAAFDALIREYRGVVERLAALGYIADFDPYDEIVTKNLYGVDINAESVEITRLALWLKTARNRHRLQNLEATIKHGDSLIDDAKFTSHPFDWRAQFPDVFARGGFDVVIGNPPYVRMEFIKPFKPYLEKKYVVAADRADLYAYFFEQGVRVLNDRGRLGFISSSTFFRTGSGENLRTFLGDGVAIETVIDFGDLQLFEGVTTYPAILTLKKGKPDGGELTFMKAEALPDDLESVFKREAQAMPRARLGKGSWQLEDDALAKLRAKITGGRKTLGEVYGEPLYGIKTGLNEAFVIDTATRDQLVKQDKTSAELLKPFLRGEDIKRWRVEPEGLFLINTPKGKVDIEKYPAIRDWLKPFKRDLEKRATKQEWWELQQAQLAYQPKFENSKIVYQDITASSPFVLDQDGFFLANTCYFLDSNDPSLLAYLNSRVAWFFFVSVTNIARGGYLRLRSDFVDQLPIPKWKTSASRSIEPLANSCLKAGVTRLTAQRKVLHRIKKDLAPPERQKLTGKLEKFWTLDFAAFHAEIKKAFRTEIPVKDRDGWEKYLAEKSAEVKTLTAEIEAAEREIDAIVYKLFDLTNDEIRLLEESLEGQY